MLLRITTRHYFIGLPIQKNFVKSLAIPLKSGMAYIRHNIKKKKNCNEVVWGERRKTGG